MSDAAPHNPLEGAWKTQTYIVAGNPGPIDGVLLLADGRWATLYFVPGRSGAEAWASAESGRYDVHGSRLIFHHELALQGGPGKPLEMRTNADREEVCQFGLSGDLLTIHFPSGNSLNLKRYLADRPLKHRSAYPPLE